MSRIFLKLIFFTVLSMFFVACSEANEKPKDTEVIVQESVKFKLPPLPDFVMFCGKKIPLDNFDVKERLDKEIIVNTYYHSSTIQGLKRANRYFSEIEKDLASKGIPEDFKYLCLIESGLTQATSPAGAKGFWQFMPKTAKEFGLTVNKEIDERLHIGKSTKAACDYLKRANAKFDDWVLTAASYNMGMGGVERALEDQEVESYFDLYLSNETSRYIFRILALKLIHENQELYGFNSEELELYEPIRTKEVKVSESVKDLKHWAKVQGSNFRMLKLLNPWIRGDKLTCKKGESLTIELPAE